MNKKTILWVTVLILIVSFCAGCGQTVTTGEIGAQIEKIEAYLCGTMD